MSGQDALLSGKGEASTTNADEALPSADEALATTEDEIRPDSTCTTGSAPECMLPQVCVCVCVCVRVCALFLTLCVMHCRQVSSSTEVAEAKVGSSSVEGTERMDGDGVLEVRHYLCVCCVYVCLVCVCIQRGGMLLIE